MIGLEPMTFHLAVNALTYWATSLKIGTTYAFYLPSWIRTRVISACKADAINQLGEGELIDHFDTVPARGQASG